MKKYLEYLKYVIEHKKNVYIECKKRGIWWHGITHDLSKFSPKEFFAYANWFYGKHGKGKHLYPFRNMKCEENFNKAWENHYKRNKHHWNHWIGREMPYEYIVQMVCDWKGMSRKFGDTAQEFYLKNYEKIDITFNTRMALEFELGLNDSEMHGYGHTLKQFANMYNEKTYNGYYGYIKDKYKVDSYAILKDKEIAT